MKVILQVNDDTFEYEGDSPLADVRAFAQEWFNELDPKTQAQIDKLTDRINAANARLKKDVTTNTPTP